jgi:hypothetical protein
VLEGETPYTFNEIYGAGNNILNLMHNDDTVMIKKGSGSYQTLNQKKGYVNYYIKNTTTGFRCGGLVGSGILEMTKDGGYNWTEAGHNPIFMNYISMSFINDTTGYFLSWMFDSTCNDNTVYDSKLVISKFSSGYITDLYTDCTHSYTSSPLYFVNDSIGYFISDFQDSLKIQHNTELRRTNDGGKTWQIVDYWSKYDTVRPLIYNTIKVIDNIVVVNSYNYYYLSTDWGNTWEKRSNDYTFYEFQDTLKAWGRYKNDQSLYFTKDRGKTWLIDSSVKNNSWNYFKCSSNKFCYTRCYFADQKYYDTYNYYVNYNPISSLNNNEKIIEKNNLIIYSNSSAITFVLSDAENGNIIFSLYTIDGKLLLSDKLNNDKNGNLTYKLPLDNFVKGIYLASFSLQNKNITKKIIIQ